MYPVSNAYKTAIVAKDRETYIAGTITLADNTVISVTNSKIKQGSLYYTNQCVPDDGFSIGHTHTGEQGITIYDDITNYRRFHGAKIELTYYLKINETDYEGVPLGIFTVVEATRPTATTIKLVGYDNMTKFDVDYPLSDKTTLKTPFQRLKDLCTALDVELWDSDADVQAQLNRMPNGATPHLLAFSPEIVTARDYLDYLCQLLCAFATIDRLGRLRIVCWKLKGTITGYEIPDGLRKKSEFSDTVLKYSAVNMSVSFYEGADDKFVKNITAPEIPTGAGEVLSLYSNALIRGGLYDNAQTVLDNIADVITNTDPENGTVMQWLPCDIQYTGDPALDLGDWVTYTGYTAGDGIEVPIHKIDWKYRGWQRLETLDINRKSERENNSNRARQEELATIIKSGVGARSIGEHAEIFNDYDNNIASGNYSHASGRNATASGDYSIAKGYSATASGDQSVAMGGYGSQATNFNAVAISGGKASGLQSTAIGYGCESKGMESIAIGSGCKANGSRSTAIGYNNTADGGYSVAMGEYCKTTGENGFATGRYCEAALQATVAGGYQNKASGLSSSILGGAENTASGDDSSVLGGYQNNATAPRASCVGGYKNIASGYNSTATGNETIAKGDNQLALGKYNVEDTTNQYAFIVGGGTSTERKNILTLDWQGNLEVNGAIMSYLTIGTRVGTVGARSFAQGNNVEASGANSHAEGRDTTAGGDYSHAEGYSTTAGGDYSHAEGSGTTASGISSHAEGYSTTASGISSHAEGRDTTAGGNYSHAEGYSTTASGLYSHTEGTYTTASGANSHAEGYYTKASGINSHAQNRYTIAQGHSQTAIGLHNKEQGDPTYIISTDDAFIIGNGTIDARSNAFRVTFDGKTYGLSAFNSSGADYAEFFEWTDGNPNNEDRVGYFVALDGDKIKVANSDDEYILGVVTGNPSVIGDSASENWDRKYVTDIYGRVQYHWVDVPAVFIDGEEIEPARQDYLPVINPDWDSTVDYVPREKRKEWSPVGIMGKLIVRDDGTCQANGYCCVADGGIATASDIGYRVLSRLDDNHIKILIK